MLNILFRNTKIELLATFGLLLVSMVSFMMLDGREATIYSPETISVFGLMIAAYHIFVAYFLQPIKILTEVVLLCSSGTHILLAYEHLHTHHYMIAAVMLILAMFNFGCLLWRELAWKQ